MAPAALVVNRIHPHFGPARRADAPWPGGPRPLAALEANLATLNDGGPARGEAPTPRWRPRWRRPPLGRIPLFGHDVHDLGGLERAADHLFA